MNVLAISILGIGLVALIMIDFLLTAISIRRQGPLTRSASRVVGAILDRGALEGPVNRYRGPILLSILAVLWIFGLWIGWTMVVLGSVEHLHDPDGTPANAWDVVGFVGSTLSTMGLGVVTPQIPLWHLVAVLMSITGIIVLTLTVSYVFNVTNVATTSRAYARRLDQLRIEIEGEQPKLIQSVVLSSSDSLLDQGTILIDQRSSFPLAVHYDREGSEKDVRRAARAFLELPELSDGDAVDRIRRAMIRKIVEKVRDSTD